MIFFFMAIWFKVQVLRFMVYGPDAALADRDADRKRLHLWFGSVIKPSYQSLQKNRFVAGRVTYKHQT